MSILITCWALILASSGNGQTYVLSGYPTKEAAQEAAAKANPPVEANVPTRLGLILVPQKPDNFRDIRIIPAPEKDCK